MRLLDIAPLKHLNVYYIVFFAAFRGFTDPFWHYHPK